MKSFAPIVCGRPLDVLGRGVGPAEGDVVAHRACEQEPLLRHDPELAAERGLRHFAQIVAVDRDPPVARVVEACEQLGDRRLAGAGVSDKRDRRPSRDCEVEPVQNLRPVAVAEAHGLEGDVAFDLRQLERAGQVGHLGLLVEHVDDLVQCGRGREESAVQLRELLHRVEEVLHVEHEGEQRSQRDRALEVEVAAVAEHHGERDRREQVDEREVEPVEDDRLHVRFAVVLGHLAEVARVCLLARERLDDPHPRDVLGERGRHEAEPLAHGRVRAGGALAEDHRRDAHERDHDQRRECQAPVEDEEQDRGAEQSERVLDEARDPVGDELVDRLDVVRQPADDHARTVALVEAEREVLQVVEKAVAQVGQDPLADPAGQVGLDVAHAPAQEAEEQEGADDPPELAQVVLADAVVDGVLGEQRRRERERRRQQQRADREQRPRAVGPREADEHPEPPARALPRPVVDLCGAVAHQVPARLPDPHEAASSASPARASTASANWRSSSPCS